MSRMTSDDVGGAGEGAAFVNSVGGRRDRIVYKVVLTGGPCAGKTTTLVRLRTFFESMSWKVYSVPEAATILLGGGVDFSQTTAEQAFDFQLNILRTILQLETTFFEMAEKDQGDVLIICDRGAMDPSAFCTKEEWDTIIGSLGYDRIKLRDARYNQVVHMVTAANGAQSFYQLANNSTRTEGIELAIERDRKAADAWVGHPYYDVVDNSTDFENKILRVIKLVCKRINRVGVEIDERLKAQSKKRKFLVVKIPPVEVFPTCQDFEVEHHYLLTSSKQVQCRIRKRGQSGQFTYTLTERKVVNEETMELMRHLKQREYQALRKQRDHNRSAILKTRRCFLWGGHYFQLDMFREPTNDRCRDLTLLETYTTKTGNDLELPDFLEIAKEVTSEPDYSMFNLSFCYPQEEDEMQSRKRQTES